MLKKEAKKQIHVTETTISHNSKLLAIGGMTGKLYVLKVVADEYVNVAMD